MPFFATAFWAIPGVRMVLLLFSESLLQQIILHWEFCEHHLQTSVLVLGRLQLGYDRSIHVVVLRPPLVASRCIDRVLAAQHSHRL